MSESTWRSTHKRAGLVLLKDLTITIVINHQQTAQNRKTSIIFGSHNSDTLSISKTLH